MAFQDYFSLVAFFIFLRETLEAAVIIAVLLQCMNRTAPRLKRQGRPTCLCTHVFPSSSRRIQSQLQYSASAGIVVLVFGFSFSRRGFEGAQLAMVWGAAVSRCC
jgi:high-affinity Fe2+/Pb2+ permease